METEEAKTEIKKLECMIQKVKAHAISEGRPQEEDERDIIAKMEGQVQELSGYLPQGALTRPGPQGALRITGPASGYALTRPEESKSYQNLFGKNPGSSWESMGGTKDTGFFSACLSGRHHPGLKHHIQADIRETVPGEGGFIIPTEYSSRIHNVSLEDEVIMPRCWVQPMQSNEINIPGMTIGDHSTALMGGFIAAYVDELSALSQADPTVRQIKLKCKKLTGLIKFSHEMTEDAPGGENTIINLCGKGLAWYRDKAFIKGSGAGEPLGILNSPALVTVSKQGEQAASTIMYENILDMMAALYAGSFKNSVWLCHQTTIPQLLSLHLDVGTGGAPVKAVTEGKDGIMQLMTRPILWTEKTEPLGTLGDIILCDLSQYVVGLRSGMRFDTSIHAGTAFTSDELLARIIERHDGQPLWDTTLTLEDGSTEVSPFVTLEAR